jgi:dTDP-4-amino-4,6-dideoxygalactose transaminase
VFASLIPVSSATLPPFDHVAASYRDIFASQMITTHRFVREFEARLAEYLSVRHVVAMSSNTTGLLLTLKCLRLQGEVIVPSFTFSATGHVLAWNGLRPVYVDIHSETCLLDPVAVEKAITP